MEIAGISLQHLTLPPARALQAVSARLEDLQREAKALAAKAEAMQRAHKAEVLKLQREKEALAQQAQRAAEGAEARAGELQAAVEALQAAAAEQRAEGAAASSRAAAAQAAAVQGLEDRLAAATGEKGGSALLSRSWRAMRLYAHSCGWNAWARGRNLSPAPACCRSRGRGAA